MRRFLTSFLIFSLLTGMTLAEFSRFHKYPDPKELKGFGFEFSLGFQNFTGELAGDLGGCDIYHAGFFYITHQMVGRVGTVWSGKNTVEETFTHIYEFPAGINMRYREYIYLEAGYMPIFKPDYFLNAFVGASLNDVIDRTRVDPVSRRETLYSFEKTWGIRLGVDFFRRIPGTGREYFVHEGGLTDSWPLFIGLKFWIFTPISRDGDAFYGTTYNLTVTVGMVSLSRH